MVCVADKMSWEDAILTTVKQPMINYPKLVESVKEPAGLHNLLHSMPQASEYPMNQRSPLSRVHESYVERNRNGGNLNVKCKCMAPHFKCMAPGYRVVRAIYSCRTS